jgi:serine-type D-Ala-D-Ala carboxypeptidase/endopeptidase (penicillin-binding protein 4)
MGVVNVARAILHRKILVAALVIGCCARAGSARAQNAAPQTLPEQLSAAVRGSGLSERVGVSIVDLRSRTSVLAHHAELPLNPASNMKLLTAAAAMIELGPNFRMNTGLYGRISGGRAESLCLKGRGDPTLGRGDLMWFAQRAVDEGLRSAGEVVVDGAYFDGEILPPLFDQQPHEIAPFRAAIGALSVKENAYTLRVRPGSVEGALAAIAVDATGYFQIDNRLTTSAGGAPTVIAEDRPTPDGVVLSLSGTVPLGVPSLAYERRVPMPLLFAGHLFVDSLRSAGVEVGKKVRLASCAPDLPLIYLQNSPPLSEILSRLGKDSDNFAAEMVLKVMGAERTKTPGKSSDGAAVVVDILKQLDVPTAGLIVLNGSGLFRGNRVSAEQISALLAAMYANPALRDEFVAHLAVGGVDGTLARRFKKTPQARIVRAKTGTLDDVIALSGYVLGPSPERAYAFAYLANGVSGKHAQARTLIDQLVDTLAGHLFSAPKPQ